MASLAWARTSGNIGDCVGWYSLVDVIDLGEHVVELERKPAESEQSDDCKQHLDNLHTHAHTKELCDYMLRSSSLAMPTVDYEYMLSTFLGVLHPLISSLWLSGAD